MSRKEKNKTFSTQRCPLNYSALSHYKVQAFFKKKKLDTQNV